MQRNVGRPKTVHTITAGIAAALFVAVVGATAAAAPKDAGGVINACYSKNSGMLRMIDAARESCRRSETAISWDRVGPQGPRGEAGVSTAFTFESPERVTVGLHASTVVAQFELPAGSYYLTATLQTLRPQGGRGNVACAWTGALPVVNDPSSLSGRPMYLQGTATLPAPGTVAISCESLEFEAAAVEGVNAVALAVGSITATQP